MSRGPIKTAKVVATCFRLDCPECGDALENNLGVTEMISCPMCSATVRIPTSMRRSS